MIFMVLAGYLIILFPLILCQYCGRKPTTKPKDDTLQHLVTVLVPTRVSWEHSYAKLFRLTKNDKSTTIQISLSTLVQNLSNGSLELRDDRDLQELLSGRLRVSGWTLSFKIDSHWWIRIIYQFALDRLYLGSYMNDGTSPRIQQTRNDEVLFLDLDLVRYNHLKCAIYDLKRPQANMVLEFTTLGLHVSPFSSLFITSAIPFLQEKRSIVPLRLSLKCVVELLSDMVIDIKWLQDVSLMHAEHLRRRSRQLVRGDERWQRAKMLLAWEAALLTEGHLTRWRVYSHCKR